jgi:hypothetical protein
VAEDLVMVAAREAARDKDRDKDREIAGIIINRI